MKTVGIFIGVAATVASLPGRSAEAQNAEWILQRVDSTLVAPSDIVAGQRMVLIDAEGNEKERTLRMQQHGPEHRLVKFQSPADVRDVGFLRLAEDQLYLYLPAFRRVRRIASSIRNEGFMGTDLSYEDLSRTQFARDYRAVASTETEQGYTLTLEARSGADVSYRRILMRVQRETWVVLDLQLFGHDGELVKTITATDVRRVGAYWMAHRLEAQTVKDGHRTVLEYQNVQVDTGLEDRFFSQRQLKISGLNP